MPQAPSPPVNMRTRKGPTVRRRRLHSGAVALVVVVTIAAAGVEFGAGGSAGAAGRTDCVRSGERVVFRTDVAIVTKAKGAIYGCLLRKGRRVRLDRRPREYGIQVFPPQGRYVAVLSAGGPPDEGFPVGGGGLDFEYTTLMVIDLRTRLGYLLFKGETYVGIGGPINAAVNDAGSVVFVLRRATDDFRLVACEIDRCYNSRRVATMPRELDRSSRAFTDLRVDKSMVSWTNQGVTRSAAVN